MSTRSSADPIPVIYDTDLGGDIDDTWALAFLAASPELDLKLVTTNKGDAERRAKLVAKSLHDMGRDDVPIAAGNSSDHDVMHLDDWAADFDLSEYAGEVTTDGVEKIIETAEAEETDVLKIIAVGTTGANLADVVERRPDLLEELELVAMSGAIRRGYRSSDDPSEPEPEANVWCDIEAAKTTYAADWGRFSIAPIDTAGRVSLAPERYERVTESDTPAARMVISADQAWKEDTGSGSAGSSTLFDTLAVYMAWAEEYVEIEELPLRVTDDGYTRIDEAEGHSVRVAVDWTDKPAFKDLLVERLTDSYLPS